MLFCCIKIKCNQTSQIFLHITVMRIRLDGGSYLSKINITMQQNTNRLNSPSFKKKKFYIVKFTHKVFHSLRVENMHKSKKYMLSSIYLINRPLLYLLTGLRCNAVECVTIKSTWSPADLSQHNGRHRSRKSPSDVPRHLKDEPAQSKKQPKQDQDRKWESQERLLSQVTLERRHGAGQRVTHCRQHCWANHNPRPGAHVLPQPAFSPPCALSAQIIPHGTGKDSKKANETFTHTHTHMCVTVITSFMSSP